MPVNRKCSSDTIFGAPDGASRLAGRFDSACPGDEGVVVYIMDGLAPVGFISLGKHFLPKVGLSPFQNIKRLVESFNVKRISSGKPGVGKEH